MEGLRCAAVQHAKGRSARNPDKPQSLLPFEGPGAEDSNAFPPEDGDWLVADDGEKLLESCLDVRPRMGHGGRLRGVSAWGVQDSPASAWALLRHAAVHSSWACLLDG